MLLTAIPNDKETTEKITKSKYKLIGEAPNSTLNTYCISKNIINICANDIKRNKVNSQTNIFLLNMEML